MIGYFVTGTDTGVGKTFVSMALARRGLAHGLRVFAFKPIETGCTTRDGELVGEDQEALALSAGNWQTGVLRGVFRFRLPAAPLVAAQAVEQEIDLKLVDAALAHGVRGMDLTIVEGAGGWRVPITANDDMGALAKRIGFPVVVVARTTLGTLNHTLLTVEAIERDGCSVAAVVLSMRPEDPDEMARSNREQLSRILARPILVFGDDDRVLDGLVLAAP